MIKKVNPDKRKSLKDGDYSYDFYFKNSSNKIEKLNFPFLFLGFEDSKNTNTHERKYKKRSNFVKIAIQSAGYACHQHYYTGWILEPLNQEVYEKMVNLNNEYLESLIMSPSVLNTINKYNEYLKNNFGAECNYSYYLLEESIYPIDVTYIDKLSYVKNLEKFLKDNISYTNNKKDFLNKIKPFWDLQSVKLYIFGENCD